MSLKNSQEVIVLSYPLISNSGASIQYNTFGVFSSIEDMLDLLRVELKRPDLTLEYITETFKVEKVNFFKGKKILRKELLNDLLS